MRRGLVGGPAEELLDKVFVHDVPSCDFPALVQHKPMIMSLIV